MQKSKHKGAFSLVELIIVLAIIGVLAAILIPVMSGIIGKANSKSALSDAKNAVTSCEVALDGKMQDMVIIIQKAKQLYVYGYFNESGTMYPCTLNTFEITSPSVLINKLIENSFAIKSGNEQTEVSNSFANIPTTVAVFSGYRLLAVGESLTLSKTRLDMAIGTTETLTATLLPNLDNASIITWHSEDESIAKVEGGLVTAVGIGSTKVYAACGELKSELCPVNVCEEIVTHDIEVIKQAIEDKRSPTVIIELDNFVTVEDRPELFPIVIPKGKHVFINFVSDWSISYFYSADKYKISTLIVNNGGGLHLTLDEKGAFGGISLHIVNGDEICAYGNLIENKNGGNIFAENVSLFIDSESWAGNGGDGSYAIYNKDGRVELKNCSVGANYGYIDEETPITTNSAPIYNDSSSVLSIKDCDIWYGRIPNYDYPGIVNHGTIEQLKNINFGLGCGVINYGKILSIQGCVFTKCSNPRTYISLFGTGAYIGEIVDCEFITNFYSEYEGSIPDTDSVAIELKNGATLGKISGGNYIIANVIVCDSKSRITHGIDSGSFVTQVPQEFLAQGRVCLYDEVANMYIVE